MSTLKFDVQGAGCRAAMRATGEYCNVYNHWAKGRWYELDLLQYWLSLPPPSLYVDIGAHAGNHAVWAALAWPHADVVAFEANIFAYQALVFNLLINGEGNDRSVIARPAAAWSDNAEDVYLRSIGPDEGMRQIAWGWEAMQGPFTKVAPETVDALVDRDNETIIVKVDTEDRVWHPLYGAREMLRRNRCRLFVEAASDAAMRDLTAILAATGYRLTGEKWGSTPLYEAIKEESL